MINRTKKIAVLMVFILYLVSLVNVSYSAIQDSLAVTSQGQIQYPSTNFGWGFEIKENFSNDQYIPQLLDRFRELMGTRPILLRSPLWGIGSKGWYTNPELYLYRVREAQARGMKYILSYYRWDTGGLGEALPPNKEDWINLNIDIINRMEHEGLFGTYIIEIHNEPHASSGDTWFTYARDCVEAIRTRTNYKDWIIIPLHDYAHDGQWGLDHHSDFLAVDPYDKIMLDFHAYWWHSDFSGQGEGKNNHDAPGDRESVLRHLRNTKKLALLQSGIPTISIEFGVHERSDQGGDSHQHYYPNDLEAFGHLQDIYNEYNIPYCMQAASPYWGGYEFPVFQDPTQGGEHLGMTAQLAQYVSKLP